MNIYFAAGLSAVLVLVISYAIALLLGILLHGDIREASASGLITMAVRGPLLLMGACLGLLFEIIWSGVA